jgi:hypothetical protein
LGEEQLWLDMERSTTTTSKTFAIEWYDQIALGGIKYQCMALLKILKPNLEDNHAKL